MHPELSREEIAGAYRLLNDLVGDFSAGAYLLDFIAKHVAESSSSQRRKDFLAFNGKRLCVINLVLALSKFGEWYANYSRLGSVASTDVHAAVRKVRHEIERRDVIRFRNTVAIHLIDEVSGRPVPRKATDALYNRVVDDDANAFCQWIGIGRTSTDLGTVVGTVMALREAIRNSYALTDGEIFEHSGDPWNED